MRLELSVAAFAVKLSAMIRMESKYRYNFEKIIYWPDSTSVLQYIRNATAGFKVFVGNRLIHNTGAVAPCWDEGKPPLDE